MALKNGRRGIIRCMIRHQKSEFERVSNNVSHERLCQVQLVINKFSAAKNLVKLFVRPNLLTINFKSSAFVKPVETERFTDPYGNCTSEFVVFYSDGLAKQSSF